MKKATTNKQNKADKREQNLRISSILFFFPTLRSPKWSLLWDVQGGKTRVKNRHSLKKMEAEKCSDPGLESPVHPGAGDSQHS